MGAQIFDFVISHFSKKKIKNRIFRRGTTLFKDVSSHLPPHLKPILRSNGGLGEVLEPKNKMWSIIRNFILGVKSF